MQRGTHQSILREVDGLCVTLAAHCWQHVLWCNRVSKEQKPKHFKNINATLSSKTLQLRRNMSLRRSDSSPETGVQV